MDSSVITTYLRRKALYEPDNVWGLAQYPFRKDELLKRVSDSIAGLNIETTNVCNANCIFCAYQYQQRATGVMDNDLYQKVIDEFVELGGGPLSLTPTVGEPLVDKLLLERIQYARSMPEISNIGMYSNMISLDRVGAAGLVASGLTWIIVSVSGFDEAMYRRVYRSEMYRQVFRNVKSLAVENNAAGRPIDVRIDMRIDRPLAEVVRYPDYLEVAEILGSDRIGVRYRYDDWSGNITPDQLSGTMKIRKRAHARLSPCSELYSGPTVYWDGAVGACGCRDVNASELIIGNVRSDHLGDIWFGEELRRLREEFMTDKIRPICATCKHYNNVSLLLTTRNRDYLHNIAPAKRRTTVESASQ
jgi:MoaA/NifB/PqqE/SkfB family radical SAM enzyme